MKKTALICADWIAMVSVMDDATAGRMFKQMLSIMNDWQDPDPDDLKFVLAHVRKFWSDQDARYQLAVEQRRQAALSRWHKNDVNATVCDRIQVDATPCYNDTDTVTVNVTKNKTNNKNNKNKIINYTSEFEEFWSCYPKKKWKANTFTNWKEVVSGGIKPDFLIKKCRDYATECRFKKVEDRYIIRPERWLKNARYDDEFDLGNHHNVDLSTIVDPLDSVLW